MAEYLMDLTTAHLKTAYLKNFNILCIEYNFNAALQLNDTIRTNGNYSAYISNGETFSDIIGALSIYQQSFTNDITIQLNNDVSFKFRHDSNALRYFDILVGNNAWHTVSLNTLASQSDQIRSGTFLFLKNTFDNKLIYLDTIYGNTTSTAYINIYANVTDHPYFDMMGLRDISIISGSFTKQLNNYDMTFYNASETTQPPTDPYNGAGDSGEGGGGGTFDGSSDPVPIPSLPPIGATDTGFISLFVPTMAQLNQVSSYLWSNFFDLATFKKIFEDPMDCILGLSVVPLTIPTSGNAQITVGNVELSGITLPLASQQYIELDCGTVDFTDKFFGSYLDQDPYTKMALFVPYSGVHAVNSDDIMGKVIGLKYHIDILTGSLVAFVMCGDSVLYEFNGACASNIPVNSINYASTIENAIRIAVNIGTTVATAGAAAPMTGAEAAGREAARTFGTAVNMAGSTAEGILSLKPNIDRAGSLGGTTGLMGNQKPYFIITRPRLCKPKDQNKIKGYPSFIETTVGDLVGNGYTEYDSIILEGLYLTNAEKEELLTILKSGVYL